MIIIPRKIHLAYVKANEDSIDEKEKENDEEELNKDLISNEDIKNEYGVSGLFERLLGNNKNLKYKDLIYSLKENKSYKRKKLNDDLVPDKFDLDFDDNYKKKEKKI